MNRIRPPHLPVSLSLAALVLFAGSEADARGRDIETKDDDRAPQLSYDRFRKSIELQVAEKREEQIQGIQRLLDLGADPDEIPDLKFRLAELFYEKARFNFFRSQEAQDAAMRADTPEAKAALQKKSAERQRERDYWIEQALALYREIREVYPGYPRMPEVLFALAQSHWNRGRYQDAVDVYADLIRTYPDSPLISDAWLGFGEFYFNEGDVRKALKSYQKAAEDERSRVYGFALYKQAWCYFNMSQWENALEKFKATVFYARRSTELSGENRIALGREAQKDYVRTYAHVGGPDRARVELADLLGEERCTSDACRGLLDQLAGIWFESGYFRESAELYRFLIAGRPDALRNTFRQTRIVDLESREGSKRQVLEETRRLVEMYQALQRRVAAGADPEAADALEGTRLQTEAIIRKLAQVWNSEARKTRTKRTFNYALAMYELYLEVFPRSEVAYMMRFQLADLYYKLDRFDEAATAYRATVLAEPEGKHLVDAANDQILAVEEHLRDLDLPQPKAGLEPVDIHPQKQRLIDACDLYVAKVPAEDAEQLEVVKFKAARVLYDYNHFDEAIPRFEAIVSEHPTAEQAEYAANLVIDIHNLREDWAALYETARRYRANAALTEGRGQLASDLDKYAQFAKFRLIQTLESEAAEGRVADRRVAEAYEEFYREFPNSPNADKALFNASVAWDRAGEKARAREARQRLLAEFRDSPLRADVAHYEAVQLEARTEFDEAAGAYLSFARNHPEDDRAPDALYDAAIFYAGMGQVKTAADLRLEYLSKYGKRQASREEAADLHWAIATDLDDGGRYRDAAERYADFQRRFPGDPRSWKALGREAEIRADELNQTSRARRLRAELRRRFARLGRREPPEAAKRWAAKLSLESLEDDRSAFERMDIVRPNLRNPRPFQRSVKAKASARDRLIARYTEVVTDYQQAESSIAALNRIATLWTEFVESLVGVSCPRGLNEEACFLFKNELETMAAPAREAGLEAYGVCVKKSRELGLFTEDSTRCMRELEELGVLPPMLEKPAPLEIPEPVPAPTPNGPILDLPESPPPRADEIAEVSS
jgi:tetratricopeptide (TPR) repeat protein